MTRTDNKNTATESEGSEQAIMRERLVRHVLGDLEGEESASMERALRESAALAREADELRKTLELLPFAAQSAPPGSLRDRVLGGAAVELGRGKVAALPVRAQKRRFSWALAATASFATAASIACAVLLVERTQLHRETELQMQAAKMLREPNVVSSFALHGEGTVAKASGFVLLDMDAKVASIAVRDLPAAPAGFSYHLWAELEGKHVPCGRFMPTADGRIVTQFSIPVDSYTSPLKRLVVTIERDQDVAAPTTSVVMSS